MLLVLFLSAWLEPSGKWYEMRLLLKYTSIQEDNLEKKLPAIWPCPAYSQSSPSAPLQPLTEFPSSFSASS